MAPEFVNVLVGIVSGILIGLVLHSSFLHTFKKIERKLNEMFVDEDDDEYAMF